MNRLNDVKISKDDAAAGLKATLEASGAPEEDWAGYMMHAADVCWQHHMPAPTDGPAGPPTTGGPSGAPMPPPPTTGAPMPPPPTTPATALAQGKQLAEVWSTIKGKQ